MALRTDVGALPILEDRLPFVSEIEKVHACRQRWTYQHTHQRCARSFRDADGKISGATCEVRLPTRRGGKTAEAA
jgi:hypothetical protein